MERKSNHSNGSYAMKKNSPAKSMYSSGLMGAVTGNPMMGMPPHNSSRSNSLQDKHIARKNPDKTPGA